MEQPVGFSVRGGVSVGVRDLDAVRPRGCLAAYASMQVFKSRVTKKEQIESIGFMEEGSAETLHNDRWVKWHRQPNSLESRL